MPTQKEIRAELKRLNRQIADLRKELHVISPKRTRRNYNGVVLYEGPSLIDNAPIVAIATGLIWPSLNRKTGDMVHVWIMRADTPPVEAYYTDRDKSVCGDCPLRKDSEGNRICYVLLHQAPASIWQNWTKGEYLPLADYPEALSLMSRKAVRLGAFGDPAAIPFEFAMPLIQGSSGVTGYTHQWRKDFALPWRETLQASCETDREAQEAVQAGWYYYRIISDYEEARKEEIFCPAKTGDTHCSTCGLCDGRSANVVTVVHGRGKRFFRRRFGNGDADEAVEDEEESTASVL